MTYASILEASKGFLVDAVSVLKNVQIEFVVIGGWCPFLRNELQEIQHPGTKDVDILFKDADVPGQLRGVVQEFLNAGYMLSAKHDFQLLLPINVENQTLVFNIDLLHPSESKENPDLFVDHFEFDFCENEEICTTHKMKSIVLPSSAIIFDGFYSTFNLTANRPNGEIATVEFPLLNETGLVLSKCQSFKKLKRDRDSFDLFLVMSQPNIQSTIDHLRYLYQKNEDIKILLNDLRLYLKNNGGLFDQRVKKYLPGVHKFKSYNDRPCTKLLNAFDKVVAEQSF